MKASVYRANKEIADKYWSRAHEAKQRVVGGLLKIILLEHGDKSFYQGKSVILKKRLMGAGVYEIWFEEEK